MQDRLKRTIAPAAVIAAASALVAATVALGSSCGGQSGLMPRGSSFTGEPFSTTSSSTGKSLQSFTPSGCSFSIAPRPEYQGFSPSTPTISQTPNIRRVRLGLGGNVAVGAAGRADPSTSIGFAWQTDDGTLASDVLWGTDPDPAKWPAQNRVSGVTWLLPPGAINGRGPERLHEAYLCGLSPATTYYYRVGGGPAGAEIWSDVSHFTTTVRDPGATVKIGVTGDSRSQRGDAWRLAQRRLRLAGVDLQLFSGDVAGSGADQAEWESWLDLGTVDTDKKPLTLGEIVMLAARGNHEDQTSLYFGNLVLPQDQSKYAAYAELFFSVDVGPVHIVVLDDTSIAQPTTDPEYTSILTGWLNEDLSAAVKNRDSVTWIITVQHRSEFSSSTHGKDTGVLRVREKLVPIWDKYHVDLALRGHDHNYERSKPLTGPAKNPTVHSSPADGTVYVVCAGVGAPGYAPGKSAFTEVSYGFDRDGSLGVYGIVTAKKTELKFQAYGLRADATDPIIDTLTMTK